MNEVVRAIDVGFGYTKYPKPTGVRLGTDIPCEQFPSLVPKAARKALSTAMGAVRNTIIVKVDGVEYEVGHDSELVQGAQSFDRTLDAEYAASNAYAALIQGALNYMGDTAISLLVLGLPVNTWESKRDDLVNRFQNKDIQVGDTTVTIGSVKVVPQPYGGYYYNLAKNKESGQDKTYLVIDPGFGTLDWIVVANGMINDARCGAAQGMGMSSILAALKEAIERKNPGKEVGNLQRLDHALKHGRPFRLYGEDIDLKQYEKTVDASVMDAVANLSSNIGGASDIDEIVVVGGPALLYEKAVKSRFPHNKVSVWKNPEFANVRGFQLMGEEWLRRKTR